MNSDRRAFLRAAGVTGVVGLAGCSTLLGSRPDLVLTIENYRSDDVRLLVGVFDEEATDYNDGTVYRATVDVPAEATGDDRWREPAVGPARRYRIEVGVGVEHATYHYHYVPDCLGDDASYDPQVNVIVNDAPGVTFGQSACGENVDFGP